MASTCQGCLWPRGARLVELWWSCCGGGGWRWACKSAVVPWVVCSVQCTVCTSRNVPGAVWECCRASALGASPSVLELWISGSSGARTNDRPGSNVIGAVRLWSANLPACLPACLPASLLACLLACGQPLPVLFALESSCFAGVGQGGPVDIGSCFCFCSSVGLRFIDDDVSAMDLMRECQCARGQDGTNDRNGSVELPEPGQRVLYIRELVGHATVAAWPGGWRTLISMRHPSARR